MTMDFSIAAMAGVFLIALMGLCLGSFASALIYRIPRDISWIADKKGASRSACPSCGHRLGFSDLVPLFSWLLARGKCRHCGSVVSAFYPLTELTAMCAALLLYSVWGYTPQAFALYLAVPFLLAALVIDWQHMILPDDLTISLGILACIFVALGAVVQGGEPLVFLVSHGLAGILLAGGVWTAGAIVGKIKRRPALGLGDVKFLVPAGLFLGLYAAPAYLITAGILGLFTALLRRFGGGDAAFPFGPALIISLYFHLFLTGLGFDYKG